MRTQSGGCRRDHLRALTQRVEVARKNFTSGLEKRIAAHTRARLKHNRGFWLVQWFGPKWRGTVDENGQYCFAVAL
jgi:hypothetical protein